jgi:hypothetical protein
MGGIADFGMRIAEWAAAEESETTEGNEGNEEAAEGECGTQEYWNGRGVT